jgi:hypothetical protein
MRLVVLQDAPGGALQVLELAAVERLRKGRDFALLHGLPD